MKKRNFESSCQITVVQSNYRSDPHEQYYKPIPIRNKIAPLGHCSLFYRSYIHKLSRCEIQIHDLQITIIEIQWSNNLLQLN